MATGRQTFASPRWFCRPPSGAALGSASEADGLFERKLFLHREPSFYERCGNDYGSGSGKARRLRFSRADQWPARTHVRSECTRPARVLLPPEPEPTANRLMTPFGFFAAAGAVTTILRLKFCRREIGVSENEFWAALWLMLFGGVIGAKTFFVILGWHHYASGELRFWADFGTGFVFFGGLLGATAAGAIFALARRL